MITKREKAKNEFQKGNIKKSLLIVKNFKRLFDKKELRTIQIAYECLTGKENFYKSIGIDTNFESKTAETLLNRL